jgi:hypothetical protein
MRSKTPATDELQRKLLSWIANAGSKLHRGPGSGLEGLPHHYFRLDWEALSVPLRSACRAAVDGLSDQSRIAAWLHIVPTGGFILPTRPALAWAPESLPDPVIFEELVLTDGRGDGATVMRGQQAVRIDDVFGARVLCQTNDWYWVRPVLGAERVSLAWLASRG